MRKLLSTAVMIILLTLGGNSNAQTFIAGLPGPPPVIDPFNRNASVAIVQQAPVAAGPAAAARPIRTGGSPFLTQLPFGSSLVGNPGSLARSIHAPTAADLASGLAYGTPGAQGMSRIVPRPPVYGYAYVQLPAPNLNAVRRPR